jgi:ATP synthase protein I
MDKNELENLRKNIEQLKKPKAIKPQIKETLDSFTIGIEIVSGVIVGLILGGFLDKIFHYKYLFLIICLSLSIIASGVNIWKKVNKNGT